MEVIVKTKIWQGKKRSLVEIGIEESPEGPFYVLMVNGEPVKVGNRLNCRGRLVSDHDGVRLQAAMSHAWAKHDGVVPTDRKADAEFLRAVGISPL